MNIQFALDESSRARLLERFAPKYAEVRCDHITYEFAAKSDAPVPAVPERVEVVGYATDENGIECLVVEINGSTKRNDGLVYHITLSRNADRKSVESNDVIAKHGWTRVDRQTISVTVVTKDD